MHLKQNCDNWNGHRNMVIKIQQVTADALMLQCKNKIHLYIKKTYV